MNDFQYNSYENRNGEDRRKDDIPVEVDRRSGTDRRQDSYNAYVAEAAAQQNTVQEAPPFAPAEIAPQQVQPVYYAIPQPPASPANKKSGLSLGAKIALWVVGAIVAATIIFCCISAWILGFRVLGSSSQNSPSSDSGSGYAQSEPGFSFIIPDFSGNGGVTGGSGFGAGGSINDQTGAQPGFGITVVALELDFKVDDKYDAGLVMTEIREDGAFKGTDVREKDMIVEAEGQIIETIEDLDKQLAKKKVGDKMDLKIARYENGIASTFDVTVTLVDINSFDN